MNPPMPDERRREPGKDLPSIAAWVALSLAMAWIGGAVTRTSVSGWYQTLAKPPFNPPDWVFTPVWLTLFVLMGVAAGLVWRRAPADGRRTPVALFVVQLALNLGWSVLFFGLRSVGAALIEIGFLWLAIAWTTRRFYRVEPAAGWLLVPYLLWVSFAVVLNGAIWWLNRG